MAQSLTELLLSGAELRTLIDAAEDILGNPLAFIDRNQNEPLLSKGYPQDDIEDKIYRRRNISSAEYEKDTDYVTALALTGRPHIIAWPNIRRRRMVCGSLVGGKHLGGIRLPDVGRPLEELDPEAVMETAQVLGVAMVLNGWPADAGINDGQELLFSILNQRINPPFLANRMLYPMFPEGSTYCMLWFITDSAEALLPDLQPYCYAPVENGFAALTDYHALLKNREALDREVRSQERLVSCSDAFSSVQDIYEHFRLAQSVYRYALSVGQTQGLALFNDYRLHHMLASVSRLPDASRYIHDGIRALRDYDREKGTEYLATLRAYLDCDQNISLAAQQLCVHKNTVFYRLGRLKSDFGLDLQDTKTLVSLYCSLWLGDIL